MNHDSLRSVDECSHLFVALSGDWSFPAVKGVPDWKDIDPRVGISYDLFGNGKTAVKASVARGVTQETTDTVRLVSATGQFNNTSIPSTANNPINPTSRRSVRTALPWWGLQVSGALQSSPQTGAQNVLGLTAIGGIRANVMYPNSVIAPSLGRNLSTGSSAVANVLPVGTMYDDRLLQLDLRVAKRARIGKTTLQITADLYNAFNGDSVVNLENVTYGLYPAIGNTSWMRPTNTLQPRYVKLGARIDF